jgi:hypothetical protein
VGSGDLAKAMPDRRYSEDEVAAIFERASEAQQTARRQLAPGEGMTLADLQAIGGEVGIPPELIAQAARSMDHAGSPASPRLLGFPIGVGRTIELDRRLSEKEWERLVVDLRETFDARGRVSADGRFRQWTNGNLQVLVEPTPTGDRIRLKTVNGNAMTLMNAGLAGIGVAAVVMLVSRLGGWDPGTIRGVTLLATLGVGIFGVGALRLPGWARLRRRQMEGVAARLALVEPPPAPDSLPAGEG